MSGVTCQPLSCAFSSSVLSWFAKEDSSYNDQTNLNLLLMPSFPRNRASIIVYMTVAVFVVETTAASAFIPSSNYSSLAHFDTSLLALPSLLMKGEVS